MPKCEHCNCELWRYSSERLCASCYENEYDKLRPNWRAPHPCQVCKAMVLYPAGLSRDEWGGPYHDCCSDACRDKYVANWW